LGLKIGEGGGENAGDFGDFLLDLGFLLIFLVSLDRCFITKGITVQNVFSIVSFTNSRVNARLANSYPAFAIFCADLGDISHHLIF
jgi:hypothetical protein